MSNDSSMKPTDDQLETLRKRLMILLEIGPQILSNGLEEAMNSGEEINPIAMLLPMGVPMLGQYVNSAEPKQLAALLTSYAPTLRALCAVDWLTNEAWEWIEQSIEAVQNGADIKTLWPPPADIFLPAWRAVVSADIAARAEQQAILGGQIPAET